MTSRQTERTVLKMTNNQNILIIKRTDYKAIKHMNREQLSEYLSRIWQRGFEKGYEAALKTPTRTATDNATAQPGLQPAT